RRAVTADSCLAWTQDEVQAAFRLVTSQLVYGEHRAEARCGRSHVNVRGTPAVLAGDGAFESIRAVSAREEGRTIGPGRSHGVDAVRPGLEELEPRMRYRRAVAARVDDAQENVARAHARADGGTGAVAGNPRTWKRRVARPTRLRVRLRRRHARRRKQRDGAHAESEESHAGRTSAAFWPSLEP